MPDQLSSSHRNTLLDTARGVAVLSMIAAHAIFFFHTGTNPLLNEIQKLLNFTVFTVFVFIAGVTTGFSKNERNDIFHRTYTLYTAYLIVAVTAVITTIPSLNIEQIVITLAKLIVFAEQPNFSEYLPFFVLITLSLIPLRRVYELIRSSLLLTLIAGLLIYLFGVLLYPISLPPGINEIKELFASSGQLLRFPLLFYLPIYLLGMWWSRASSRHQIAVMIGITVFAIGSLFISQHVTLIMVNPAVRWPPSIGYLSVGVSLATILFMVLPLLSTFSVGKIAYQALMYLGQDALDLWICHLLILFAYRKFVSTQFEDIVLVILALLLLLALTIISSSITITKNLSFLRIGLRPFASQESRKIKKRYLLLALSTGIALVIFVSRETTTASIYGNVMPTAVPFVAEQIPENLVAYLSVNKKWLVQWGTRSSTLEITIRPTDDQNRYVDINPNFVNIMIDTQLVPATITKQKDKIIKASINVRTIPIGEHLVSAVIDDGTTVINSGEASIFVTQPLLVAWTFDWEGWDAANTALKSIDTYGTQFTIPFTHFINPRMFLNGVLTPNRYHELTSYLLNRQTKGDELALHLHMQHDLVEAAGITPRTSHPWGLMTKEGYDIPTSEYTADEFQQLIRFSKTLTRNAGLPDPLGFRAGGWFITSQQLQVLEQEGFIYDSSGRNRPTAGAFYNTPWNLPVDINPYFPDPGNQNAPAVTPGTLLEIPNNGGSTYELSLPELTNRLTNIYQSGVLSKPKSLVYVSHPQFATQEFAKIPQVLTALQKKTIALDGGPVVFVTVSDIYAVWQSPQQ